MRQGKPVNRVAATAAAAVIVALWLLLAGLAVVWLLRVARR